ncbi:non-hydrolyzing UDP-N-acetylglucosamine 2-epimerase [Amycolatopsis suaedae]|uniref:UDP-N-acetylglucosamine 2-epimerase (non-hydrolyzing) n=1 Tax=Amycolatopsis suaedae TaxID=2510978 RepID=A0A4Q7J7E5_9PSEU|nr:UDP-N-acetylglucosamine 2-epimerase (non-hydrolyzing) [Amycolatopsis suaedae]RZQ62273.1 UDP-N-acetylglucosamine 2-epimerase (non-hydrolyzing) [Amycolatopsis suaedae]
MSREIMLFAGTRPEAIKLAPVALSGTEAGFLTTIVATGQHPTMVEQGLAPFGLFPDFQLELSRVDGSLSELCTLMMPAVDELLAERDPAAVVVQGDTATTLVCALVAFWRRIPVVHLEAGLRTGDLASPFPEEANRQLVSRIASLHLTPTPAAATALVTEGVPAELIETTGNTVVDAARYIAARDLPPSNPAIAAAGQGAGPLVLVTVHRRESWGHGIAHVLEAVRGIVREFPDVSIVLPAHPNPDVRRQVVLTLGDQPNVTITEPLDYPDLVWTLSRSALVITDSGGIQEEAPTFRVPALVVRETTERREAVEAGLARLVGTDSPTIVAAAREILNGDSVLPEVANPFGAGDAADRSVAAIGRMLGVDGRKVAGGDPLMAVRQTSWSARTWGNRP